MVVKILRNISSPRPFEGEKHKNNSPGIRRKETAESEGKRAKRRKEGTEGKERTERKEGTEGKSSRGSIEKRKRMR